MPLTLDALTILEAIERRGSFARAAEELARAPSSLTYAVQQIEADREVAAGRLAACQWSGGNPRETLHLAWRSGEAGRALEWWTRALSQPGVLAEVLDAD